MDWIHLPPILITVYCFAIPRQGEMLGIFLKLEREARKGIY